MTDSFTITPLPQLLQIILNQFDKKDSIFGFPSELFFKPSVPDPFRSERFGQLLETPIGVAAGPHTQLAQNIVVAWLTGARFIELKTVQTLDELNVAKPCIDMQDEGYNCEWSQELKIHESFDQYLDAWIIIHILKDKFKWADPDESGVIFNMSVGYDYEGILQENIQWFFDKMENASAEIAIKIEDLKTIYPEVVNLKINPCISDNITLSTMHGCPPDEIEKIGKYLIEERKLHTAIKLNPTLLGRKELQSILNNSGFGTKVPDVAFEHDLKFNDATGIIKNLQKSAKTGNVKFSLKLTNTLESNNHKNVFASKEEMMYMSGRALHPVSVKLALKLLEEFDGKLDISFCAGVDTFNVTDIISCGLYPVTICSDILKPGGYGRLNQYLTGIKSTIEAHHAKSLTDFIDKKARKSGNPALQNLQKYASEVLQDERYKKTDFIDPDIKTKRQLNYFDCIHAPCVDTCPTHQDIPNYLYQTASEKFDTALNVITETNPFPRMTGMVCDHLCQSKCTRINYDSPVLIRDIKRFIAENANENHTSQNKNSRFKAAVIGAGPSGLSCAYFLANAGFTVNIYENKSKPGGMVSGAIPAFRLTDDALAGDIERIEKMGVEIHYNYKIDKSVFENLQTNNDFIYIAIGAQHSAELKIDGLDAEGVIDSLQFLFDAKLGKPTGIGKHVAILGGGNTAMDAARTAFRLVGKNGKVTVIYRRTKKYMPADIGEIKAVLEEGMEILELTAPLKINTQNGKVASVSCCKMKLGDRDGSGRPQPLQIPNSKFDLACDTIIPAIGQEVAVDFIPPESLKPKPGSYETGLPDVFIGGDAMRGASTAINAIGDGRKAAMEMIRKAGINLRNESENRKHKTDIHTHMVNRSKRKYPVKAIETPLNDRKNFKLVSSTLTREEAIAEASRCLLCDELCNICTTVCPNLAFHSYKVQPQHFNIQKIKRYNGKIQVEEDEAFEVKQDYQILHIADWCNKCGNCTTFCPSSGSPFKDKPHLYLDHDTFENEKDGYYYENMNNVQVLHHKEGQLHSVLTKFENNLEFRNESIKIELDKKFRIVDLIASEKDNFEINLKEAVEMKIIMQGAASFFS